MKSLPAKATPAIKNLAPEDALLFALCRLHMTDALRDRVHELCRKPLRWERVVATAEAHGVAPLVASNLLTTHPQAPGLTDPLRERLSGRMIRNMALEAEVRGRLRDIVAFFEDEQLDLMLVKGAAMSFCVYDRPWYTTSWDLDLIVGAHEADVPKALRGRIGKLLTGGPCYIEYNYLTHHDLVTPGGLHLDFAGMFERAIDITVGGRTAKAMACEDMLLAACINSCRKRFFRLKALLDISEIVRAYPDLSWSVLAQRADESGCSAMVYAALHVARSTLDAPVPADALKALHVHPARRALIGAVGRRMSFASLENLDAGHRVFGRRLGPALLLPYATYSARHVARGLYHVVRERHTA